MVVGCTATGVISLPKLAGTIVQVAALNYTGPLVSSVDTLVTAFTGQPIQRPNVQQYPQDGQYPSQPYPDQQYPSQQYPDQQYYLSESQILFITKKLISVIFNLDYCFDTFLSVKYGSKNGVDLKSTICHNVVSVNPIGHDKIYK